MKSFIIFVLYKDKNIIEIIQLRFSVIRREYLSSLLICFVIKVIFNLKKCDVVQVEYLVVCIFVIVVNVIIESSDLRDVEINAYSIC